MFSGAADSGQVPLFHNLTEGWKYTGNNPDQPSRFMQSLYIVNCLVGETRPKCGKDMEITNGQEPN